MNNNDLYHFAPTSYITKEMNGRMYLYNKMTKLAFSLELNEFKILCFLSSPRSFSEISEMFQSEYTEKNLRQIIDSFSSIGVFNYSKKRTRLGIRLSMYVNNFNNAFMRISKPLIYSLAIFLVLALLLANLCLGNILSLQELNSELSNLKVPELVLMLSICIISIFLHELSHAIVGSIEDAFVPEISFSIHLVIFKAQTTIVGIESLAKKYSKILIYAAGNMMHFLLINIGLLLYPYTVFSSYLIFPNMILLAFNSSIFYRSDLYKILALFYNAKGITTIRIFALLIVGIGAILIFGLNIVELSLFNVSFALMILQSLTSLIITLFACLYKQLMKVLGQK